MTRLRDVGKWRWEANVSQTPWRTANRWIWFDFTAAVEDAAALSMGSRGEEIALEVLTPSGWLHVATVDHLGGVLFVNGALAKPCAVCAKTQSF